MANTTLAKFPDPFADISAMFAPTSMRSVFQFCDAVLMRNSLYREALRRIVAYFNTEIRVTAKGGKPLGKEEENRYKDFLYDTLQIHSVIDQTGQDWLGWGNSFVGFSQPFRRYLWCPQCRSAEYMLSELSNPLHPNFSFSLSDGAFSATCPICRYSGPWERTDRLDSGLDRLRVVRWNPYYLNILYHRQSDSRRYIWSVPEDQRQNIRAGKSWFLAKTEWETIEAVRTNSNILLHDDTLCHLYDAPPATLEMGGWGLPKTLSNFGQAVVHQIYNRANQAMAWDHVVPLRVITPDPTMTRLPDAGGDPVFIDRGRLAGEVGRAIARHRKDPASWSFLSHPVVAQVLGGDPTNMVAKDLIELAARDALDAVGMPQEMYRMTLTSQAAPAGMRLFQAFWTSLSHSLNRLLNWLARKISRATGWEFVELRLEPPSYADDINRQMAKLQLMSNNLISRTTGLESVGIDLDHERRQQFEEQKQDAVMAQESQEELEQMAMLDSMSVPPEMAMAPGGQPQQAPPGAPADPAAQAAQQTAMPQNQLGAMGVPSGPGGAAGAFSMDQATTPITTVQQLQAKAQLIAEEVQKMDNSRRQAYLANLAAKDPVLHAVVSSIREDIERNAKREGGQAVLAQQYGAA